MVLKIPAVPAHSPCQECNHKQNGMSNGNFAVTSDAISYAENEMTHN